MTNSEPIPGAMPLEAIQQKLLTEEKAVVTPPATATSVQTESTEGIEQIKKELLDPRTISKKHDPEGRSATARAILEARAEKATTGEDLSKKEGQLDELGEQRTEQYQAERQTASKLSKRLESVVVKLKAVVGLSDKQAADLQAELNAIKIEENALLTESLTLEEQLQTLKVKQGEIPNARTLVEAYYEKIQTQPLNNEEKRQLLRPEVLSSLTTEEYIALWKRLNPYFLSHVTRQGFRDHNGMVYHSAGMQEFHNGFKGVIEDNKLLRPKIVLHGLKTRDEVSVRNYISDWVLQAENQDEALNRLHNLLNFHLASAPKYPDETTVHFAAQVVANSYYGGETGNEIFFIYPSDAVASQHHFAFNGQQKDFTRPQSETKWNDVFVWPETIENPGIPLDAGLVFLPETTPVDSNTGSKYASEITEVDGQQQRVMVEDTGLVGSFVEWGKGLTAESPLRKAFQDYQEEQNCLFKQNKEMLCRDAFSQELQKLGFNPDAATVLGSKFMSELYWRQEFSDEILQSMVRDYGANWKMAESTVPAKEYWEGYFAKNPQLKPAHIIYYDGNPTTAVLEFQQKNGIGKADTSKTEGNLLGFDDHHIVLNKAMSNENQVEVAIRGYRELEDTAKKIITDHYAASVAQAQPA